MLEKNFSMMKLRIGTVAPMRSEAKGSMMTEAEELRNTPVYLA